MADVIGKLQQMGMCINGRNQSSSGKDVKVGIASAIDCQVLKQTDYVFSSGF